MMGDGGSGSSGSGSGSSSSRGAETVVIDHGRRKSSCGYCRSTNHTSISHGLWALSITAEDYQELLDRGWRRSGCFLYKPEMEKTCCPSYTIRLKVDNFVPSKEQVRVDKRLQRFLDGTINMKNTCEVKDKPVSSKGVIDLDGSSSSSTISEVSLKESSSRISTDDEFINYLSTKINDSIRACVASGEFSSSVQLPKSTVKKVSLHAKKKLNEISKDLLYTSNIAFQIAAVLRNLQSTENRSSHPCQKLEQMGVTPNYVAEKLVCFMEHLQEPFGLSLRACNGHLNFYLAATENTSVPTKSACTQNSEGRRDSSKTSSADSRMDFPKKKRKLEIRMNRSSFDPDEFALYKKYQIKVHGDKPEKVTENSYRRFLVETPIISVPSSSSNKTIPHCGLGSFHQQYIIDGKLVAVGVVDILPRCLSSKYLFWDPDFAFLSLGKYSALQEINWIKDTQAHCPSLQYYYLGYYIHSCRKMRYKAAYRPSELLCLLRYKWVPYDIAKTLLDNKSYAILSDYATQECQASPPQIHGTFSGQSGSTHDQDGYDEASSDDEDDDLDYEVSDMVLDDESDAEAFGTAVTDDIQSADISNIMIDLNGSRVGFKDLAKTFGPIEKRHIVELGTQLRRYVKAVGEELSGHMVYSLG